MGYEVGARVRLGQLLDALHEVVEVDVDGNPALAKVVRIMDEPHPGVWPWVIRVDLLRPAD